MSPGFPSKRPRSEPTSPVVAVLGPTNTGKTHLAMERMLGHATGMIGFPLRLLARENYDRAVAAKGRNAVALITGEEKIVPAGARYFLCTVESMPVDRRVSFLGVDEIQMCADPDRGHVFTDRLLHARGETETMFMGAETIKGLLRELVPGIEFQSRPRFSTLTYTGEKKLNRLAARSAVVAFSAADVYAIAEMTRRHRGGAAVVLGALSPRTRNAQVAMYQAGEVDYLIATDAIGMGLNMDVDHVAFAATRKFDGRAVRALTAAELAQTAGRAGRHMNNGTFGTTADIGPLDAELAERIETHRFDPLRRIFWRNPELRFQSVEALRASLTRPPERPGLIRAREADDELALAHLAEDPEIARAAVGGEAVRLLWDVCQVPDFRKVMSDAHARLLGRIYLYLAAGAGRLPADWVAGQVTKLDRTDGDIETLIERIAAVRTWTYVSYQAGWLDDPAHWQGRTRAVEDKLSDALHDRLTQRFVDRRTAHLMGRMKGEGDLLAAVDAAGEVLVEGHFVGRLDGFRFRPDGDGRIDGGEVARKAVFGAAQKALKGEIQARVKRLEADADDEFGFGPANLIEWRGQPVARAIKGAEILKPAVDALSTDLLEPHQRERIRRRVQTWLDNVVASGLAPLLVAQKRTPAGAARGLLFQLAEHLVAMPRCLAEREIEVLTKESRQALRGLGVTIGRETVYMKSLLKQKSIQLCARLHAIHSGTAATPPPAGCLAVAVEKNIPVSFYRAVGFHVAGGMAIRADALERFLARAWALAAKGAVRPGADLAFLIGVAPDALPAILKDLGFRSTGEGAAAGFRPRGRAKARNRTADRKAPPPAASDSPFAKLGALASRR